METREQLAKRLIDEVKAEVAEEDRRLEALRQAKDFAQSEVRRLESQHLDDPSITVQDMCDVYERFSDAEDAYLEALSVVTGIPFDRS